MVIRLDLTTNLSFRALKFPCLSKLDTGALFDMPFQKPKKILHRYVCSMGLTAGPCYSAP